jgi:aminoglycoside phosphotransferase (APT) family kinase protein
MEDERRQFLRNMMKHNHGIVFAHGDLHPGNILIHDGRVAAILDWEMAGWYPEYWE